MDVRELDIAGAWELTPRQHADERGVFLEWVRGEEFAALTGHRLELAQANCSVSRAGTIRGIHFAQLPPSQAKYVTCMSGAVLDVVVDLRVGSPTYGRWEGVELDDEGMRELFVPVGFAHGFCALSETADVLYKQTAYYDAEVERGIAWDDPDVGIEWPVGDPTLSERDRGAPRLTSLADDKLFA